MSADIKRSDMLSANPPGVADALENKHAFIAGAGGLGSNVATMLVRAGIGSITIVDFDVIEPSNLNRQQFFYDQLGQTKVEALKENLERMSPFVKIAAIKDKLTDDNFDAVIPKDADIIFECFDNPVSKADLVRFCISNRSSIPTIAVSGIAGYGPTDSITCKKSFTNLYMIGDSSSAVEDGLGTLSTRVMVGASLQAHTGISVLLENNLEPHNNKPY